MMFGRSLVFACLFVTVIGVPVAEAQFQGLAPDTLRLDDFSAFQSSPENWSIVDSVWADPARSHHLRATSGTGVLVNRPTEGARGHLRTQWTHGDVEIEMDVLMPRGSNSGIYLQGRYEVQLLDSWDVQTPTFGDMGGIYQRWDDGRPEGERGFEGHPPRVNVAKAPGLWQHLKIHFRAPRFNEAGKKVEDARFEKVTLNGVVIHRNIELSGPTRAAAFQDETPAGPLLIQGDHGPVAIKNIRYKRYRTGTMTLSDLQYKRYDVRLDEGLPRLDTVAVAAQGSVDRLSHEVLRKEDDFVAVFEGTLTAPRTGTYTFDLLLHWITGDPHFEGRVIGGGRLHIDDHLVMSHTGTGRSASGSVHLQEGDHQIRLLYFKNRGYAPSSRITLFTEGPQLRRRTLTADVLPMTLGDPIHVTAEGEPTLLRSFFQHAEKKNTHVISVGTPGGSHYAYDLAQGSLLRVWKSDFLRANPMWEGRGHEQRAIPLGSGPVLSSGPSLAVLPQYSTPWPDSVQRSATHEYLGYRVGEHGYPRFRYRFEGLQVTDQIRADSTGGRLTRRIRLSGQPTSDQVYLRVLRSKALRRTDAGRFVVGDRAFYVDAGEAGHQDFRLRRSDGARELLLSVSAEMLPRNVRFEYIW